jgi:HRDC domain/UvrD-like helicase C-terminal domain
MLKEGAQVMFVKNDSSPDKKYYNGKIGHITNIEDNRITVQCDNNEEIDVSLEEWSNTRYTVDEQTREIMETVDGTFIQYPLKAAWAITIHKSQGLTFERAIIDAAAAFSHGQVYVALSRCKTLEGMVLISKLGSNSVIRDVKVKGFTDYMEQHQPDVTRLEQEKQDYFTLLLVELFDYHSIQKRLQYVTHLCTEHLEKLYPELVSRYIQANRTFRESLTQVGERFKGQLMRMVAQSNAYEQDPALKERVVKGVEYFKEQMETILMNLLEDTHPDIDNKEVRKSFTDALDKLQNEADLKMAVLEESSEGFDMKRYMQVRAKAMIEKKKAKPKKAAAKVEVSSDILNPALYKTLAAWRKAEAERLGLPAYTILQQKALIGICNSLPATEKELLKVLGIGKKVLEKYGEQLLQMVADALPGQ